MHLEERNPSRQSSIRIVHEACYVILASPTPSNAEAIFVQSTRMQDSEKTCRHCRVGIHCKGLTEYSQMNTHIPVFSVIFKDFCIIHFVLSKLATRCIRVNHYSTYITDIMYLQYLHASISGELNFVSK